MKLALGTVQFGIRYGVNNQKGIPSDYEINSILQHAKLNGIKILDSASAYGNAEAKIGEFAGFDFSNVSKFSTVNFANELRNQLMNSLNLLRKDSIYAYMAHDADILIKNPKLWEELQKQKNEGKVNKIGYSIYTPKQLESLLKLQMIPDIVQLPYSILDRKFEKYFVELKLLGIEIHSRSVFLQGLYFLEINTLPLKFESLRNELTQLKTICKKYQIDIGSLSLNFVYNNSNIDYVVIGVDSLDHLKNNLNYLNDCVIQNEVIEQITSIKIKSPEMLNPVNW